MQKFEIHIGIRLYRFNIFRGIGLVLKANFSFLLLVLVMTKYKIEVGGKISVIFRPLNMSKQINVLVF